MTNLPEIKTSYNIRCLNEINRLNNLLKQEAVDFYLMGSWAVSVLNGAFVKDHTGDVDLAVTEHDCPLDNAITFLESIGYRTIENRQYNRKSFIERWYRLQGPLVQMEIGNGFYGERIPTSYIDKPLSADLYGTVYKVAPIAWLIKSYERKGNIEFYNFLGQYAGL